MMILDYETLLKTMQTNKGNLWGSSFEGMRVVISDYVNPEPKTIICRYPSHPFIIWLNKWMRKFLAARWCPDPYIEVERPNPKYKDDTPLFMILGNKILTNTRGHALLKDTVLNKGEFS